MLRVTVDEKDIPKPKDAEDSDFERARIVAANRAMDQLRDMTKAAKTARERAKVERLGDSFVVEMARCHTRRVRVIDPETRRVTGHRLRRVFTWR